MGGSIRVRPRSLRTLTHRLLATAAVGALGLGGVGLVQAAPAAAQSAVVPGDIDGDGNPDIVLPDPSGNGNLIAVSTGAGSTFQPRVVSTAAASPEHDSWRNYRIAHYGSLTGSGPDDLFALNLVSHKLYSYRNDAASGGTAGQFTNPAGVGQLARPACNTAGLRCGFYAADWSGADQIVAGPGHNGGTGPTLIDNEAGAIYSFGWTGSGLSPAVNIGAVRGSALMVANVGGAPTLWAGDEISGVLYTKQLSYDAAGLPTGDFAEEPTPMWQTVRDTATGAWMGATPVDSTSGSQVQYLHVDPFANAWAFGSDGTVRALGKCLDATGNGTANGTKLELWDCNGGANQQWSNGANGSLFNPVSGRCMDNPYGANTPGTQLQLWDCNGGANQRWFGQSNNGPVTSPYLPVSAIAETVSTFYAPGDTTNGNPDLYTLSPGGILREYPGAPAAFGSAQFGAPSTLSLIRPGHVRIQSADLANKCVDSPWGFSSIGTATNLFDCTGGSNQVWTLAPDLSVQMGSHCVSSNDAVGNPLFLDRCRGDQRQRWVGNPNGAFQLPAGPCMTDPNGSTANPVQLQLATCTGAVGQKWTLTSAT
ncbi:ricin-type beta-trefoil lectin domain protein [Kitasatospora sp. NPDC058965]|uniref:ricin-type beta-trefoil lectin domain protein n=1 Tax=Kitasatospora sp. NPDC058965 TaxID=3346682 RepID=UPI003673AB28